MILLNKIIRNREKERDEIKMKIYKYLKGILKKYRTYSGNDIDYENAKIILKNVQDAVLIDVRSPQEYKEEHLENSINIPLYDITKNIDNVIQNKETTIIVCCQSGNRSKKAIEILSKRGYKNLYNIVGGIDNI